MGDSHAADPHMPTSAGLYVTHMNTLDALHDHDFQPGEFENTAHHSLSPFSMNNMGGTLSRPASMASMTNFSLPPNSLSRVGSLSNLQSVLQHQMQPNYFYNPQMFTPAYPVQQQQHQVQQYTQQQSSPTNQMLGNFPMLGAPDFRMLQNDYSIPTQKPAPTTKQPKKPRKRAAAPPPPSTAPPATVNKQVKLEKSPAKQLDGLKPQRSRNPSSIYRGVSKCSKDGRWQARIRVKRQVTYLGRFVNEEDAARRYDEAAREHHGDKAVLNFPTAQDKQLGRKQATSAINGGDEEDNSE